MLSVSVVGNPSGSGIPSLSPQPGARSLPDLRGETFVLSDAPTATAQDGLAGLIQSAALTGGSQPPRGGGWVSGAEADGKAGREHEEFCSLGAEILPWLTLHLRRSE